MALNSTTFKLLLTGMHSVAKQRVMHILWKSLACVLWLLLQNLHYFEFWGIGFFHIIYKWSFYDPLTFACFTLFFTTLLNKNGHFLEYIQFVRSVMARNASEDLFPLGRSDFGALNEWHSAQTGYFSYFVSFPLWKWGNFWKTG